MTKRVTAMFAQKRSAVTLQRVCLPEMAIHHQQDIKKAGKNGKCLKKLKFASVLSAWSCLCVYPVSYTHLRAHETA